MMRTSKVKRKGTKLKRVYLFANGGEPRDVRDKDVNTDLASGVLAIRGPLAQRLVVRA